MRGGASRFRELSALVTELVERWDDLGAYFGVHRANTAAETSNIVSMETQVFNDGMSRPRFAVLNSLLRLVGFSRLFDFPVWLWLGCIRLSL